MKPLLLILAAAILSAQQAETMSNGIRIRSERHTEGVSIFVTPSGCRVEAIRLELRTSKREGWDTQVATKPVFGCDQRQVEFRFLLPGEVLSVAAYELAMVNQGSAK